MSARRIGRIEAGEGNPTYDEMLTLASGLGVKASALFAEQP
jgi:transcriptional regulator with XRE-family HTH domain